MKIVLATPLYPPEIASAAAYAKELARRLAEKHDVTVVAYTHLPEPAPDVTVVEVDKRQPRLARLRAFQTELANAARDTDAVIAINGASVELPLLFTHLPKTVYCVADKDAHKRAGLLERLARLRAAVVVKDVPTPKPEILPLEPVPKEALVAWERSWHAHMETLERILTHDN